MSGHQSHATPTDLLVLHALRCIGFTSATTVAAATGLAEFEVESALIDLAVDGLVSHLEGPFGGWGISDAGRAVDAERIAADLDAAAAQPTAVTCYEAFLVLNPQLLEVCTAWQLKNVYGAVVTNDHGDPAYDARVLERLAGLHRRAETVLAPLGAALPRFARYPARLAEALARARAGALEYVAESTSSYHTVWFQLHEDLLVTLGLPRH